MYWEPVEFTICEGAPDQWRQVVDTGKPSPDDFADEQTAPPLNNLFYTVKPRSIVVLTKTTAE